MTKKAIKEAALEFFATSGYEAASLAKIATEAGIKKPSIYAHFDSKEALFLEIYQDILQTELQELLELEKTGKSGTAFLKALFYYLTDLSADKAGKQFSQRAIFYPPEAIAGSVRKITKTYENLTIERMRPALPSFYTAKQTAAWLRTFYMLLDGLLVEGNLYDKEEISKRRDAAWLLLSQALLQKEE